MRAGEGGGEEKWPRSLARRRRPDSSLVRNDTPFLPSFLLPRSAAFQGRLPPEPRDNKDALARPPLIWHSSCCSTLREGEKERTEGKGAAGTWGEGAGYRGKEGEGRYRSFCRGKRGPSCERRRRRRARGKSEKMATERKPFIREIARARARALRLLYNAPPQRTRRDIGALKVQFVSGEQPTSEHDDAGAALHHL